jgi:hypothetical protein
MLVEKTTWQNKVQNLAHDHVDRAIFFKEEEEKFIPLQQKIFTLKKVVDNNESEMLATEESKTCQSSVGEIRCSLFKLLNDLKVLEKELEWQGFLWKR